MSSSSRTRGSSPGGCGCGCGGCLKRLLCGLLGTPDASPSRRAHDYQVPPYSSSTPLAMRSAFEDDEGSAGEERSLLGSARAKAALVRNSILRAAATDLLHEDAVQGRDGGLGPSTSGSNQRVGAAVAAMRLGSSASTPTTSFTGHHHPHHLHHCPSNPPPKARQRRAPSESGKGAVQPPALTMPAAPAKQMGLPADFGQATKASLDSQPHKPGYEPALPRADEDDSFYCPTCLDPYTEDNPKMWTACSHHFHLPCLFEWLERKDTCPVCSSPIDEATLLPQG